MRVQLCSIQRLVVNFVYLVYLVYSGCGQLLINVQNQVRVSDHLFPCFFFFLSFWGSTFLHLLDNRTNFVKYKYTDFPDFSIFFFCFIKTSIFSLFYTILLSSKKGKENRKKKIKKTKILINFD